MMIASKHKGIDPRDTLDIGITSDRQIVLAVSEGTKMSMIVITEDQVQEIIETHFPHLIAKILGLS